MRCDVGLDLGVFLPQQLPSQMTSLSRGDILGFEKTSGFICHAHARTYTLMAILLELDRWILS